MKILCIADHVDPLVYSLSIKTRFKDVDLVISAGDLPINYYDYIVSSLNKPLLFVFGNHIARALKGLSAKRRLASQRHFSGALYIDHRAVREKKLLFAGLGGSMWYNGGENQFTQRQMTWNILKLVPALLVNKVRYGRYLDIFLTHAPPFGINDRQDLCHTGFKSFLWFMRKFKPRYLIHGHVHLYSRNERRISCYCSTLIVNAYDHHVIYLDIKDK